MMTAPHEPDSDVPHDYVEPTPEMIAERAKRADKATRGALAGVLGLEAMVVLLVPRAIAFTSTGLGPVRASLLIALAVVMIAVAAVQRRRPWAIGAGSVLQLVFIATGFWLAALFAVAAVFTVIWLYLLTLRHELVGTPGGARMLVS